MAGIFISYAHEDSHTADEIVQVLRTSGIEHFRDVKDISWGDAITSRVRSALLNCEAILVVVSPASLESHWVPYEIGHASALGKPVLPFLTDPLCSPPQFIRDLNCATSIEQVSKYFADKSFPRTDLAKTLIIDGRMTTAGVAAAMELVVAEAKIPMFFTSNDLGRVLACNRCMADLLGTSQQKVKKESAQWLVEKLISLAPLEKQSAFREHQKEMSERFLSGESDYDYEDQYIDCRRHSLNNPLRGEWQIRIHAHRVRDGETPLGFFIYYSLDPVAQASSA